VLSLDDVAEIEVEARHLAKRELRFGDIIIEKSGGGPKQPVGRVVKFELDEKGYSFSNFTSAIRVNDPLVIDYSYLHHVLNWWYASGVTERIQSNSTGIRNLDFDAYKKLNVPLPPLAEQKQIVAVLDEAFEGLSRARANAEANLIDAKELFNTTLGSVFSSSHSGWATSTIGSLCTLRSGTTVPKELERSDKGIPYVKVGDMNLQSNIGGVVTSSRFLRRSDVSARQIFPPGTTIFPKRGGAILTNKKRLVLKEICADLNVMGVIPGTKIDPEFVYFYFLSVDMRKIGSGASIPQINNYDVEPLPICYPEDLGKQQDIVAKLKEALTNSGVLSATYSAKVESLEVLRQSLLQKAFSGELT